MEITNRHSGIYSSDYKTEITDQEIDERTASIKEKLATRQIRQNADYLEGLLTRINLSFQRTSGKEIQLTTDLDQTYSGRLVVTTSANVISLPLSISHLSIEVMMDGDIGIELTKDNDNNSIALLLNITENVVTIK